MDKEIKAVVFDMDGVLIDSERISNIAWCQAGAEYKLDDIEGTVLDCTGSSRSDQWIYLRKKYGHDFPAEEFRERCSEISRQYIAEHGMPLLPYAREILEYLKEKRIPIALASSTRKVIVHQELKNIGLFDFFDTIVCGDEVEHSKPLPDIYLKACSQLGLEPEVCVAVEDSPNGIKSAKDAGMMPVMVPDQIQPTEEIKGMLFRLFESLEDLKTIV